MRQDVKIEYVPVNSLKPWDKNPRKNDAAVKQLASVIEAHGFVDPIIATPDRTIRAGHTRWKAAKKLGITDVPCVFVDYTEKQAEAFAIAHNKSNEWAEWDPVGLAGILEALKAAEYPLAHTGFTDAELDDIIAAGGAGTVGLTDPDDVPAIPEEPTARLGQIWRLGEHRVLCGDATNENDWLSLLGSQYRCDLCFTDPPYGVDYTGKTKDALKIQNDSFEDAAFVEFLTRAFKNMAGALDLGAAFYICHADSKGYEFRSAAHLAGLRIRQCLVWVKQSLVMGRQDYQWRHEPILYGWRDGGAHTWNGGRALTTVWEFARPTRSEEHPTMKPVEMIEFAIKNSSNIGASVLDPFLGSGSTLIACEKSGRSCFGIELDPKYVDVIIERWERFTGKNAELEEGAYATA